ncbi:hypothetical protein D3C73_1104380 [compost metagenome]
MQYRQRGFQTVGQIGKRGAVFGIALAFVANQNIQIAYQPAQFAGGVLIELFSLTVFQFADLIHQRLDRSQAPIGRQPQQGHHQQQVSQQHIAEPFPDDV